MSHACHIEERLKEKGLRLTDDRHRLLELFEESRTWTASEIMKRIRRPDRSTIYRNVRTLLEEGLIVETHSHEEEARYERADRDHHDHLACSRCAGVLCIPCPVPSLSGHMLEINGICKSCL